jgi:hypothetical protein
MTNLNLTTSALEEQLDSVLLARIDALEPNRRQMKASAFTAAYPAIRRAINRGVTQKAILKLLAEAGIKLHPARYKAMMAEAASRSNSTPLADSQAAAGAEGGAL